VIVEFKKEEEKAKQMLKDKIAEMEEARK